MSDRCPKCGKPSASPPAEVYCVDCATEGWEQDAAAHKHAASQGHQTDERFTLRRHINGTFVIFREVLDPDMGDDFWVECERIATFKTREMARDFMRGWQR